MAETASVAAPAAQPSTPATPTADVVKQTTGTPEAVKPDPIYELDVDGTGPKKFTLQQVRELYGTAKSATDLRRGAHQKFEEAAKLNQVNKAFEDQVKSNPAKAFVDRGKALGLSREQIQKSFEDWYNEEVIKPSTMNEDQRRAKEYEAKWKQEQEEKAALLKEKEDYAQSQADVVARDQVQKDIIGALDTSGLPKTRFTVARMAYWMKQNIQRGYDAPMDVVVQQVKDERAELFSHEFGGRTIDEIITMAGGEDFIKKVRKYDLERIRQKLTPSTGGTEIHEQPTKPGAPKRDPRAKSMREVDAFFNNLRRTKR